jgi:diacylglycerol kinase family enzyme
LLLENSIDAEIEEVPRGADVHAVARELAESGRRTLVAAGGDGTVSAVAAAAVRYGAILGVIPLGGLNHFARDLGIPLDTASAVRTLREGAVRRVDAAEVNGRIFVNNSGLGLYPYLVVQREARRRMGQRKWIALFWAALATLRRLPYLEVRLMADESMFSGRTPFVFIGNNSYRMEGFRLGSRDALDRGELCVGVARYRIGRIGLLRVAFRALFGRARQERDLEILSSRELHIHSRRKRVPVSLDGEVALMETPLRYRIQPGALQVIAP